MAYGAYARFLDPKDEPNYSGLRATDIEIDAVEISRGQWLPINLLCDFAWDEFQWMCTACFIQTEARHGKGASQIITADYVNALGRDEWAGLVGMVEGWANENLAPEDFVDA